MNTKVENGGTALAFVWSNAKLLGMLYRIPTR
jgi:hypothetical protein